MRKPVSQDVIRLYVVALRWKLHFHSVCPEVGMGPSIEMLLDDLIEEAGIPLHPDEEEKIIELLEKPTPREPSWYDVR